ncbi:MAG TPA: hypothetical protein VG537_08160 [Candidatus Kapabacteria bacterium]|nr:hypothetical protein [Candidatus Kapabacteria bacterium]
MKITRIIAKVALYACLSPAFASAQSFWLHTAVYTNQSTSAYQLSAADTSDYVFAQGGFYPARTVNNGNSWNYIFLDTGTGYQNRKYTISGIVHPSHNLIVLGCNDRQVGLILRSTDAGKTWMDTVVGSYDQTKPPNTISAISALDSNHISVMTNGGLFLHSSDGGVTWQSIPCPIFPFYAGSSDLIVNIVLDYLAPNTLVVSKSVYPNSAIYVTTNLGSTWDSGFQMSHNISKFAFINAHIGFASGILWDLNAKTETATIDKTTDGGLTWFNIFSQQIVPPSGFFKNTAGLFSIAFADSLHGLACGDQGLILRTIDGGATWAQLTSDFTFDIQGLDLLGDIAYPDTNHAIIASSSGEALVYHPNGILSLPNITYPQFSPPSAPRTFDVTWDPVPGATRYSISIKTSNYPNPGDTTIATDANVTAAFYHLSNLVDTSPPPGGGGRYYYIYLQAFNATNQSNIAQRTFIVYQSSSVVTILSQPSALSISVYPNPATNWLDVEGLREKPAVIDAFGRSRECPWQDGKLDVTNLAAGVYYVIGEGSPARFVKE